MKTIILAAILIFSASFAQARVFWNKFEVSAANAGQITLTWNVTEYNNKSFIVQHSINGNDWEDIAIVPSLNSVESMTDYSYSYSNRISGKHFFRLRDFDVDKQSISASAVRTLDVNSLKQALTIWPNPASSFVVVSNDGGNNYTAAKILDLTGKIMLQTPVAGSNTQIDIATLPAGIYLVRIENKLGSFASQKIVKQ